MAVAIPDRLHQYGIGIARSVHLGPNVLARLFAPGIHAGFWLSNWLCDTSPLYEIDQMTR